MAKPAATPALARSLARPLEQLAAAASRLGAGDFSIRVAPAAIPEVDSVARALTATAQRLEDLINRERAFSADASHQLRTPLQALRIELEAAQLRGDAPPEVQTALAQVDRLETTIATLLAVARDTHDDQPPPSSAPSSRRPRLAARTAGRAQPAAAGRVAGQSVAHQRRRAGDPRAVRHPARQRHSPRRRRRANRRRELAGWLAIDVGDEGPGFAAEPDEAFPRQARSPDGHGIGLALARSLAHAEGNRLSVTRARPAPILTLYLPTAPAPSLLAPRNADAQAAAPTAASGGHDP